VNVETAELSPGVMRIRIDYPEKKNALSAEILAGLADALDQAATDPKVRVVVLTAVGDVFCGARSRLGPGGAAGGSRPLGVSDRDTGAYRRCCDARVDGIMTWSIGDWTPKTGGS